MIFLEFVIVMVVFEVVVLDVVVDGSGGIGFCVRGIIVVIVVFVGGVVSVWICFDVSVVFWYYGGVLLGFSFIFFDCYGGLCFFWFLRD